MGRRSRKRGGALPEAAPAPARAEPGAPAPVRRRGPDRERPKAPWHPFPLVELSVLIGLVLLVWGLFRSDEDSGRLMLVCGMALASLGGLDTALREHFGGYRSHSMIIAGVLAVGLAAGLYFAGVPWIVIPVSAVAAFCVALWLLVRDYRRRER
jgi:hypothetical protein